MLSDQLFRLLLAACLLAHVVTRGVAHLRAGTTKRRGYLAGDEGVLVSIALGVCIAAFVGSMIVFVVAPAWISFAHLTLSSWVRLAGFFVAVLGLALSVWVHATLGRYFNPTMRLLEDHALIEHGPYARVRHPMYTAVTLLMVGGSLMAANAFSGVSAALTLFVLMIVRTPIEERMLEDRFGEAYRDYARRTGRYLPRVLVR